MQLYTVTPAAAAPARLQMLCSCNSWVGESRTGSRGVSCMFSTMELLPPFVNKKGVWFIVRALINAGSRLTYGRTSRYWLPDSTRAKAKKMMRIRDE